MIIEKPVNEVGACNLLMNCERKKDSIVVKKFV